jgi:hypothetical protein
VREFFRGWRRKAGLVTLAMAITLMAACSNNTADDIAYIFHFTLTDAEIGELLPDVAELAWTIRNREMNRLDPASRERLFKNCHYRNNGKNRVRLLWGLDGKRPTEGQKCIWVDLDAAGVRVVECGFAFVG